MWIAQDNSGCIAKYVNKPYRDYLEWFEVPPEIVQGSGDIGVKGWEYSLINLETHDYKIEDGILMKVEKPSNTKRHKHADLIHAWAEGEDIEYKTKDGEWRECAFGHPSWGERDAYRIKPKTKTVRFRNYLDIDGDIMVTDGNEAIMGFSEWIGDWQEIEVPE